MALTIRLWRQGCTNHPSYRIVVTDKRAPRDGKYVEAIGCYEPHEQDISKKCSVQGERLQYWLAQGAEISETVKKLATEAAPQVMNEYSKKVLERRTKRTMKRRA